MANVAYGSVPFSEQIAFFRRKLNLKTNAWTDIWQEQHDHAFVVAGANRDDLVADFRAAVDKAISEGGTLDSFRKDFDAIVAKHGWSYNGGRNWRSRVIYETNLRTSYAAGRYEQLQAVKALRPFWRYRHSDSVLHPRPMHLAWNGLVLHADDPWWRTHYPPNGWGCQCTVEALSHRDLVRLGKDAPDKAPAEDPQEVTVGSKGPSPRVVETPAGVDPGFGYAPGASAFGDQVAEALTKTAQLPATWAAESAAQTLARGTATDALDARFGEWFDQVMADPLPRGRVMTVGAISPAAVDGLVNAGIEPATAAIVVRDVDLLHAQRAAKVAPVLSSVLRELPKLLRDPQAVMVDPRNQSLLYVFDAADGTGKVAVRVNYRLKGSPEGDVVNVVRTASMVEARTLQGSAKSGETVVVDGSLP